MSTTVHERSLHIDAPPKVVFDYIADPRHFYDNFPGMEQKAHPKLVEVKRTPEGEVSSYVWEQLEFMGFRLTAEITREESIPGKRIVDHSSTGPVWTYTLEPDETGTTLSLAMAYSTRLPLADKVVDRVAWRGDRDLEQMLANTKSAIEA